VSWVRRVLRVCRALRTFNTWAFHTLGAFDAFHTVDNLCTFCIPTGFLLLSVARYVLLLSGWMILAL
jgi:hypothetical protein